MKELEEQLRQQQARLAALEQQEATELEAATDHSRREYMLQQLDKALTDDRCAQITKHMAKMILLEHKITSSQFTNWDDRFVRLEHRVDELSAQQSKILDAIQSLTAQLAAAKLIAPQLPLLQPKPSPPSSPPSTPPEQTKVATVLGLLEGPALKWATSTSSNLQQSMEDWAFGLGVDKFLQALEDRFADKERALKGADRIAPLGQQRCTGTLQALFVEFEQLTSTPRLVMSTDNLLTNFCRAAPEKFDVALYSAGHKDWRSFGHAALEMEAKLHVQAPSSNRRKGAFPRGGRRGKAAFTHVGSASGSDSDSQADAPSTGTGSVADPDVAAAVTQAVQGPLQLQRKFFPTTASATAKGNDKGRRPSSSQRPNFPKDVRMPADPLNPSTLPWHDLKIQEGVWRRRKERGVCLRGEGHHFLKDCPYMPGPDAPPVFCPPEIQQVVDQYTDLMQEPFGLPNRPTKHHIELLPGAVPPKGRIYRMSPAELEELRKQLETLTSKGWIRPSTSEFGALVHFVPKGNGEFRMCIDYRGLNKITRKSTEPVPRIDDLLGMVQGCTMLSKVDLKSGYHQIEMAEEDVYKTAFNTRYGTYEFLVMPFGLCNAPGTFQTEMHCIFRPYLNKFMVVYLDDILVFSKTVREHAKHLALVLQSLRDSQYKINREKFSFGVPSVIYLCHVISGDGLAPEAAKIAAIQEWPQPQTVRDVRSFMGLASYYRKFVRNFYTVAAPLTNLTKKDTPFLWSLHCQLAFTRLKKALTRAPVLKLPDPTLPFILTIDASQYGIGAFLQQDNGNGLRPVEFMSKKIKTQKLQDSTYEKELYALVCALKHWKHFLLGRHFKIFSDHSTLQWMKSQGELNDKLARYIQFIDMFDFEMKHKKGCYNKVADALSRRPDSFAPTSSTHSFGEETRQTIARLLPQDETFGPIVRNLQADANSEPGYALSSDLLYTCSRGEERLCIPQDQRLRTLLMSECHDARGHLGFLKSYAALSQRFFWKEMRSDMLRYVDTCELCQRNKVQRRPPLGLLKPLPIPNGPAESVSIDFTDLGRPPLGACVRLWSAWTGSPNTHSSSPCQR
ncbi:hypothetical protein CBR_g28895 [Chara braunii]|uniref:Reverse transcriptase domain-containing protein n=1 Tax=Chara braunii TaxID=69332 RepID=A0A388LA41_CHABU|nr:hypothetical protein CBR_g28895 [Chara braunii]|eukprot:GBG79179.1 hypothetical protein CBR_g28895 [Chara braunii]